jgi:ribonuclease T1
MLSAKSLKFWAFFLYALVVSSVFARELGPTDTISRAALPIEAQRTLELIERGGPFPYAKDGSVFRNYEGLLPKQGRGYYREFTVRTPGVRHRGARRIIAGGYRPDFSRYSDYYYTHDHYASFRRIDEK